MTAPTIILKPASSRPIILKPASTARIVVEATAPDAPVIRLLSGPAGTVPGPMGEISAAQAAAIAEEAATRERNDPLALIEALLNTGL